MDELIEAQIARQVLAGEWQPFYAAGQGREGLYYYWLAPWLALVGEHVLTLRLASAALSLLGLAATAQFLRLLFSRAVAVAALGLAVTSFWILFAARSGLRSTSLPLVAALAGICFWRGLRGSRGAAWRFLPAAGILTGLAFYTYTAARVLPFIWVAFVLYLLLFRREWLRERWQPLLAAGLLLVVTAWPLLHFLRSNPEADQFAFMEFNRPLAALESGDPEPALRTSLQTVGMFAWRGDPLIFDNVPDRPVFDPLLSLFFLGGLGLALWRIRRPAYALALIWLGVSLVPGMLSQPAPNFYRTVGAQVVTFLFPALAVVALARSIRRPWGQRLLPALLAILVVVQLAGTWRAYFQQWPEVEGIRFFWQTGLAEAAAHLEQSGSDLPATVCTNLIYEYDAWWRPAWQSFPYLRAGTEPPVRFYDCRQALVWPDAPAARFYFPETGDPAGLVARELAGQWLAAAQPLPDVSPSGEGSALEVRRPADAQIFAGASTYFAGAPAEKEPAALPVTFAESVVLLSYRLEGAVTPGGVAPLITYWEVRQPLPPGLSLFAHVLADPLQPPLAQQDGLGLSSNTLVPGDRFLVLRLIPIPPELPPGTYDLSIGLYETATGQRLPVAGGDRIFLAPMEVGE